MRWSFATLFFIGVMGVAAWFVFNEAVKGGGFVEVPDVQGLPVTQAANVLAEAGLEVGKQESIRNNRMPEFHVLVQRPAPGKVIRTGREIALTISGGKKQEVTPNVVGRDLKAAVEQLGTTQFAPGVIARVPSKMPLDFVLAQDPRPEKMARVGSDIHLLVSAGPAAGDARMPNLIGVPIESAIQQLAGLGVEVVPVSDAEQEGNYDVVLGQEPQPESPLFLKQTVTIEYRPRDVASLPNMRRKVDVAYVVPNMSFSPQIRMDIVTLRDGRREQKYPKPNELVGGEPPRWQPGTKLTIPDVTFASDIRVEFFADDKLHMTYTYKLQGDPVKRVITEPNPSGGVVASTTLPPPSTQPVQTPTTPSRPVTSSPLPPPTTNPAPRTQTPGAQPAPSQPANEVKVEVFEPRTERVGPAPRRN